MRTPSRDLRRPAIVSAALLGVILTMAPSALRSAEPVQATATRAALETQRELEKTLLEEGRGLYPALVNKRQAAEEALKSLYFALRRAVLAEDEREATAAGIERISAEIELAEARRAEAVKAVRLLTDRIRDRKRRIELIDARLADLDPSAMEETKGRLTGNWRVVLLPVTQRGVFRLEQSGTVVSGTYDLDGGWSGSLQGTLVNNKVFLVRIDSRLGKSMEFEGFLSADGLQIRGSWLDYELADGKGGSGQWSARKETAAGPGS